MSEIRKQLNELSLAKNMNIHLILEKYRVIKVIERNLLWLVQIMIVVDFYLHNINVIYVITILARTVMKLLVIQKMMNIFVIRIRLKVLKLIKQETKPCPTCGVRIYKISGCDQIWCVECKVAFSWRTGIIDKGVIHNPHFYEHMRNNNNGIAPRNPHDEVCGGLISVYQLRSNIINKLINFPNISQKVSNVHRIISHITYQSLVQSRENVRRYQDFKELRILYILNKKTKAEMATQIYRSDNLRKKYTELLHIDELFSVVGIEVFNTIR